MIKQTATGLNSRSEANPFNENGFLPLITAPMYSVVDESNYQVFLDNKLQVCLPRSNKIIFSDRYFSAMSLDDFKESFIVDAKYHIDLRKVTKICIDTANGNMTELHDAIRKAKEIHGDNLIIMAGNVGSVEAFIELAKTGVDYIRVGIGSGGGCNTTSNTGVGQENLEELIFKCSYAKKILYNIYECGEDFNYDWFSRYTNSEWLRYECNINQIDNLDCLKVGKVKIVADGISSYIKQCEKGYGFNDNGYAAINKLLFAGADLVMVGKLFAQCVESAGEKAYDIPSNSRTLFTRLSEAGFKEYYEKLGINSGFLPIPSVVEYSGMSTQEEQKKYKKGVFFDAQNNMQEVDQNYQPVIKPSEGSIQWIPVRWTLDEWLNGSNNQDQYPYLMGWVNSVKSAMAYTDKTELK